LILPDVNVLVHAFRADSSDHELCHGWLASVVNGESHFGISTQVLSGFARIVTHPRVFVNPSPVEEALGFADVLLASPNAVVIRPGERHWSIFARLCLDSDARGNLVPDAWFAALAIESGCEWVTLDRDYARFRGLRWSPPK
jgi:toxin-antitoxin system PIN domain toxin